MEEEQKKPASRNVSTSKSHESGSTTKKKTNVASEVLGSAASISEEEVEALKKNLEKAAQDAAANLDGWQRERAEFVNYKKRIERDQSLQQQTTTGNIIKKYLVVLDDLDLALKNRPTCGEASAWADGIELVVRKLQAVIDSEGIERINQNKIQFDPNFHEAISNEDNPEFASGEIIEVVRQGYKLGDRILRPAMVRVAR